MALSSTRALRPDGVRCSAPRATQRAHAAASLAAPLPKLHRPRAALAGRKAAARTLAVVPRAVAGDQSWAEEAAPGQVKGVEPGEWRAVQAEGYAMLDVRPQEEVDRAAVVGSVHVPLYMTDDDPSLAGLLKQLTNTFAGFGWWLGGSHMKMNAAFLNDVQAKLPDKGAKVLVACQKGLRSLKACEQLVRAGYTNVAWLSGGYDAAKKGDFDTVNGKDIRYGGAGGVSALIGWTKVQQEEDRAMGGGVLKVLGYVAVFAVINILSIAWQAWGEYSVTGKLPDGLPRIL